MVQLAMEHGLPHDGHAATFTGRIMEHLVQVRARPKVKSSDIEERTTVEVYLCRALGYHNDAQCVDRWAWTSLAAYDASPIYITDPHRRVHV